MDLRQPLELLPGRQVRRGCREIQETLETKARKAIQEIRETQV
jgi:hypothetical protein